MRSHASLRVTLLIPLLLSVAIGFGAFAVYVEQRVRTDLTTTVDEELARVIRIPPSSRNPPEGEDDRPIQLGLTADGSEVVLQTNVTSAFLEAMLASDTSPGTRTLEVDREAFRVLVSPAPDGTLQIAALPFDDVVSAVADLRRSLVVGALVMFGIQGMVVWIATARATRPVVSLTEAARRVAGGDLDHSIQPIRGPRETVELAADLERMLQTLRDGLHEQETATRDATRAREAMARFLADAAHELRTPLTALRGYSELYDGNMLTEDGALDRAMARIGTESLRLERLVASLLQLARGAARPRTVQDVDLRAVVADVADDLRAAFPDRTIIVETASPTPGAGNGTTADHGRSTTGETVRGDAEQLHQIVLNLGANACQHTTVEVPIEFEVGRTAEQVVVRVIDHGAGLDPADAERVFEPFFKGDPSRSPSANGNAGLGLALTQQIVVSHGGTIALHQTQGGGTTIEVTLPTRPTRA